MLLIRLTRKLYKQVCKNYQYLILLGLLSFVVWLTLHYFKKEQTTQIISVLGISFALFQFFFNQIATKKRKKFDLRYVAYQDIIKLVDSLCETLHEETSNQNTEVDKLLLKVSTQINRINSALNEYDNYLFPDIKTVIETSDIIAIMNNISSVTYQYRTSVFTGNIMNPEKQEENEAVEYTNWFFDVEPNFQQLEERKYKFYDRLRQYFD